MPDHPRADLTLAPLNLRRMIQLRDHEGVLLFSQSTGLQSFNLIIFLHSFTGLGLSKHRFEMSNCLCFVMPCHNIVCKLRRQPAFVPGLCRNLPKSYSWASIRQSCLNSDGDNSLRFSHITEHSKSDFTLSKASTIPRSTSVLQVDSGQVGFGYLWNMEQKQNQSTGLLFFSVATRRASGKGMLRKFWFLVFTLISSFFLWLFPVSSASLHHTKFPNPILFNP